MIIVKIDGGLGNQLFQYAFGKKLSLLNKTELYLDLSAFSTYETRTYELDKFNIQASVISEDKINNLKKNKFPIIVHNALNKNNDNFLCLRENKKHYYKFNQNYLKTKNNVIISGYFQSEKYFHGINDILKNELTLNTLINEKNKSCLNQINDTNSISLHIRRGDYIYNPSVYALTQNNNFEYYNNAIKIIKDKVKSPYFYIFTDDPSWVEQNLNIQEKYKIINNNLDNGYEDIRLMYSCKHNIIANSSFSWWGAWLNNNEDKVVVAPSKWVLSSDETYDVIPKDWIKI